MVVTWWIVAILTSVFTSKLNGRLNTDILQDTDPHLIFANSRRSLDKICLLYVHKYIGFCLLANRMHHTSISRPTLENIRN